MQTHYCTNCGKKVIEKKMSLIYSFLLRKSGWICQKHLSSSEDILHTIIKNKPNEKRT